jgi:hypothetical protein
MAQTLKVIVGDSSGISTLAVIEEDMKSCFFERGDGEDFSLIYIYICVKHFIDIFSKPISRFFQGDFGG